MPLLSEHLAKSKENHRKYLDKLNRRIRAQNQRVHEAMCELEELKAAGSNKLAKVARQKLNRKERYLADLLNLRDAMGGNSSAN